MMTSAPILDATSIDERDALLLRYETEIRRLSGDLARARRDGSAPHLRKQIVELRRRLLIMQSSKFWRVRNGWFALKKKLRIDPTGPIEDMLPMPSRDRMKPEPADDPYARWLAVNEVRLVDENRIRTMAKLLQHKPTFSVIMPVYNTPEVYLREAIESVVSQLYPHWELCIADDASTAAYVAPTIAEYVSRDPRIRSVRLAKNGHISASSNAALELATGEFIALLDHDDVLTRDALFENALAINVDPRLDMIYSDEDKIDDDDRLLDPYFKPDWSPDTFLTRMYTCHLGVYRRSLVEEIGGFRLGFEGSQDYDLVLRLTERTDRIHHIPTVLYHWRIHAGSVTGATDQKPYAYTAAVRALNEAIERRGEPGRVSELEDMAGFYTVRYEIVRPGKVSVIIPTRNHGDDVRRCLGTLFELTDYPDYEVILVDNGTTESDSLDVFREFEQREPARLRVLRHNVPFNFSEINNFAAREARGSYLLFLNNDTSIIKPDWMTAMVEQAQRRSIGAVGAKLLYEDDRIQHAGVVVGIGGIAGHPFRMYTRESHGYFNLLRTICNYSAVTAACMMVRRDVFEQVDGFDEGLRVAYNDVDLCLRIQAAGYHNIYLPHVELYHYESQSRGYDVTSEQRAKNVVERTAMERRWGIGRFQDRCYNPNLTLEREDFSLADAARTVVL